LRPGPLRLLRLLADRVDVQQHDRGPVDRVVQGHGRANAEQVQVPGLVPDLPLIRGERVDDPGDQAGDVLDLQVVHEVADRPTDVRRDQVEYPLGQGGEATDPQIAADQDDRDADPVQQVDQVVVGPGQLGVAVPQLLVDRVQFLVG